MNHSIFHLYQLQKLDSQLDLIGNRLSEIHLILSGDKSIQLAEAEIAIKEKVLGDLRNNLQSVEKSIIEKRLKIEQSESSLYGGGIKNPKELQDLQNEIESIKSIIHTLEDTQLSLMFDVEIALKELVNSKESMDRIRNQVFTSHSQLTAEINRLEQDAAKLKQERTAVMEQIPLEVHNLYKNLREKKKGIAVSLVEDQCCSACGATLTPAECQSAKSPNGFTHCTSCGRLLYAG
jgi:predicted  nucleic acid-binding Zn-ribbon protein